MLLTFVTLLVVPVGCRLGPEPDPTIYVTWWVTFAEESAEYAALKSIADTYSEQTADIVVEVVPVPWDDIAPRGAGTSKLELAQEEGSGPDLWGPVPHNWTGSFALSGQALALGSDQIEDVRQYVEIALRAGQFDGKQYGVPVLMDALALIYNRDLVPEPPASFEEWIDLAHEVTDPEQDRWALAIPLLSQYHIYPFMDGYGGYIFRCDTQACDLEDIGLNNEGAVRGTQFLSDLYVVEKLFPEPLADRAVMHEQAHRLFTEGKAAMLVEGSWVVPELRARKIDFGVAAIPALPGTGGPPRSLTLVQALYVSPYSAHLDETLALLNYVAGQESVTTMQAALGKTPVRRDILRSEAFRNDRAIRAWGDQASNGVLLPNVPELGYVWQPWVQALEEAIPGLTPTQEALDQAVEQIRAYLEGDE